MSWGQAWGDSWGASLGGDAPPVQDVDHGTKLRKSAKDQRYIYRRERIEREVPQPVAEAIERVVEHFEGAATPTLGHAAALFALELGERGVPADPSYTGILLKELARLREEQGDEEEINAVLIELLR